MRRDPGQTPSAAREERDPDKAMELAGGGPDAHSAQGVGLAPEDIANARRSVAEADRKAEAREEREEEREADSPDRIDRSDRSDRSDETRAEPIGWTGAPEDDERAESEHATPPPEEAFREPPPVDDALTLEEG